MDREHVLELMKKKDDIEKEIKDLTDELEQQNGVGMKGELVDKDQYPRNDIDIFKVRQLRQKVICLQNDHKSLMKQIENGLYVVHETVRQSSKEDNNLTLENKKDQKETTSLTTKQPFCRVDIVSTNSPADRAGLKVNDLILRIGSITKNNFRNMQDIASLVTNSENRSITLLVLRDETNSQTLTLTPQKWSGQGLLGAKITPLAK